MTTKRMLLIITVLVLVNTALIVEIGEGHISRSDIASMVGFVAGAGFVVAFYKGGKSK